MHIQRKKYVVRGPISHTTSCPEVGIVSRPGSVTYPQRVKRESGRAGQHAQSPRLFSLTHANGTRWDTEGSRFRPLVLPNDLKSIKCLYVPHSLPAQRTAHAARGVEGPRQAIFADEVPFSSTGDPHDLHCLLPATDWALELCKEQHPSALSVHSHQLNFLFMALH